MKKMKRMLVLALVCALLLPAVPMGVQAAEEPTIVLSSVEGAQGSQVEVTVSLENNPGFVSCTVMVDYDSQAMTLVEVRDAGVLGNVNHKPELSDPYTLSWMNNTAREDFTVNGAVATLVFEIHDTTANGDYPITLGERSFLNVNGQFVDFAKQDGVITADENALQPATGLSVFDYYIYEGELCIAGLVADVKSLTIAESYEVDGVTYPVTWIDDSAFSGNTELESVVIPQNVYYVGEKAFYNCTALKSITVLNAEMEIGTKAFGYYKSGRTDKVVDGLVLNGFTGSTTEDYALDADILFAEILRFAGASVSLQNNLAVNYKVDAKLFMQYGFTDPQVVVEFNGVTRTLTEYTMKEGKFVFSFRNIAPDQLGDVMTATLYANFNGQQMTTVNTYSVADYCYRMLANYNTDDYAKLRTLLVDLLNYGAATQQYTGYKTDALVNADLTDAQKAWGTAADPELTTVFNKAYATVENPVATWKGAGLQLQDAVSLRVKFAAESVEGLSVKISTDDRAWIIPAEDFGFDGTNWTVFFNGLNAAQMRQSLYLTVCNGDTPVSDTVCYSVESYAYEKQNSTIEHLGDLVKAMMRYGDAAYAYTQQ